ncbi:SDR family NAD(P)-dependent oxidoreductase [Maribacter sp. 2307ULW6-5]|uniref:SDR family NAD(P)-dependent oxidoreductase n=1 Tax=Maribacter sp. 2307ULW6-5 TaxID=3386275 RepID=UPI0039BC5700
MANIIVTGSSRGIGLELVRALGAEGHRVLAISRNTAPLEALGQEGLTALSLDLSKNEDLDALASALTGHWNTVDVLVNNAGAIVNKPFLETPLEDFRKVYEVNVFAVAALMKMVIPKMPREGHVLNVSSMGGVQGSMKFPGLSAYSSSKGALITLTEMIAEEFKETGPSCNALALGAVQTEMLEEAFPGYKAPVSAKQMARYIKDFCLTGHHLYNGKLLQVSSSTP